MLPRLGHQTWPRRLRSRLNRLVQKATHPLLRRDTPKTRTKSYLPRSSPSKPSDGLPLLYPLRVPSTGTLPPYPLVSFHGVGSNWSIISWKRVWRRRGMDSLGSMSRGWFAGTIRESIEADQLGYRMGTTAKVRTACIARLERTMPFAGRWHEVRRQVRNFISGLDPNLSGCLGTGSYDPPRKRADFCSASREPRQRHLELRG
jgi:hypothetical protein